MSFGSFIEYLALATLILDVKRHIVSRLIQRFCRCLDQTRTADYVIMGQFVNLEIPLSNIFFSCDYYYILTYRLAGCHFELITSACRKYIDFLNLVNLGIIIADNRMQNSSPKKKKTGWTAIPVSAQLCLYFEKNFEL